MASPWCFGRFFRRRRGAKVFQSAEGTAQYTELPAASIGDGSQGQVRQAIRRGTNMAVAIKSSFKRRDPKGVTHEIDILRELGNHQNVIEILDMVVDVDDCLATPHMVMKKCHRDLWTWLQESVQPISASVRAEITRQLFSGLAFLHERGVVHCDLHQKNVLVHGHSGQIKITDFGSSRRSSDEDTREHVTVYKRRDIRSMTQYVVISMWLDGMDKYRTQVYISRLHFLYRGVDTVLVGKAQYWMVIQPNEIYRKLALVNNGGLERFDDSMNDHPGLLTVINDIHSRALTTQIKNRGLSVPDTLHEPLRYGCLVGPATKLTASYISEMLDRAVSQGDREVAQQDIRLITIDMVSTDV
ncbi:cyclin-dependent kinase 4-like [Sycon ciliatum]|uniref:cyclin-dependent kinase 4-like n=1 Tax=Sycon ciliatum TaxID=27933 RepID=UPI0031F6CEEC